MLAPKKLTAAFGPRFEVLPKELFAKVVPVERIVMMGRVSMGARQALALPQIAAFEARPLEDAVLTHLSGIGPAIP